MSANSDERCPVCQCDKLDKLYPEYRGVGISSDHKGIPDVSIANRVCHECGLIFNARGVRSFIDDFYRNSYQIMCLNNESEIKDFSSGGNVSQAMSSLEVLLEMADLGAQGHFLEAGAGKGSFTKGFFDEKPGWSVDAFEPSRNFEALRQSLPEAHVERCTYSEFPMRDEGYHCIVALGVLEHVPDPLDMLAWAQKSLASDGCLFIRVPNFARNPNDLFTVDHLSKLTVPSLHNLAARAGLEVVDTAERGVSLFMLMRPAEQKAEAINAYDDNRDVVEANQLFAQRAMEAIGNARQTAQQKGGKMAVFGLASSGLFSPFYLGFPAEEIEAYIDENQSVQGARIHGRPVAGLEAIAERGITDIALVISPVYHEQVTMKLMAYDVRVHASAVE